LLRNNSIVFCRLRHRLAIHRAPTPSVKRRDKRLLAANSKAGKHG
jgi:hypothetical protein